jgi:lysozyme|tara:strand:+ start:845 stop:1288 length:444 start_codon:yes stop_codon:yes gene_type:complete
MKTGKEGIALIKKFEGCRLEPYFCSANVLTVGYGHTKDVVEDMHITEETAETLLQEDLKEFEEHVSSSVDVELTQNQFDALVAWTFNLGAGNLKSSTMLKVLNEGKYAEVPEQMRRWNKAAGKVLHGLVRRRTAESLLFEDKDWKQI